MWGVRRRKRGGRALSDAAISNGLPVLPLPLQQQVTDARLLLTVPWVRLFNWILEGISAPTYLEGTHADRLDDLSDPGNFRPGTWFWETDRTVMYQARPDAAGDPAWIYTGGTMRNTLDNIPADLGVNDTGFLFFGTDYAHTWRWTGSEWRYAPGDRVSGEIAWFTGNPLTAGWAVCDGTSVTRTQSDSTTASFTTPNLIGSYPKGADAYSGTVEPGTDGTVSGTTGSESAHTHGVTTNSVLSDGSNLPAIGAGAGSGPVADPYHAHTVPGQTVISGAGTPHTHDAGTLTVTGGEPQHVDLLPYFRL